MNKWVSDYINEEQMLGNVFDAPTVLRPCKCTVRSI